MDIYSIDQPTVLETIDYESILTQRKQRLLELAQDYYQSSGELDKLTELEQTLALESEPLVKLLQESAYREMLLRQRINDAARAVMVPLAQGSDLDNLGALYGLTRGKLSGDVPEGDELYRQRLLLAPKSLSTAGSKAAYRFHALSAGNQPDTIDIEAASSSELHVIYRYNGDKNLVKDATVESPSPCEVQVHVLGFDQYGLLESDALADISEHLSGDNVRPLGDRVTVSAADIQTYGLNVKLHLSQALEGSAAIETLLRQIRDQLVQFVQKHHYLGKAIRRSTLLGTISPLVEGWVELTLLNQGQALPDGQDLVTTIAQAPHLDLSATDPQLNWQQRTEQALEQSIEVLFDG